MFNAISKHPLPQVRRTAVMATVSSIIVAGVLLGYSSVFRSQGTSAAGPELIVEAPSQVRVGEPIVVTMRIRNANDIAGYETRVLFDTSVAHLRGLVQRDNDLRKLGRDVQALGPIEIDGGVVIGAFSCPYKDCAGSAGVAKQPKGGRGEVRLATFSIVADAAGQLTLTLDQPRFVDVNGAPVTVTATTLALTVTVVGE